VNKFISDRFSWEVRQGDALSVLADMSADSIDCVMTSPPYWGLRDYGEGTATIFGGDDDCDHDWVTTEVKQSDAAVKQGPHSVIEQSHTEPKEYKHATCQKCGAWYGQLGLEPHPSLYLEHLWKIFDEVKCVLKPTGTCWVNMGDTYFGGAPVNQPKDAKGVKRPAWNAPEGGQWLKPKNLMMMPARFAIGMQERGWWLRNDICWHKPNAMPSSVKDRFSCSWEHIFFFTKSARYWFDLDAVREAHTALDRPPGNKSKDRQDKRMSRHPVGGPARRKTSDNPRLSGARQAPEPGEGDAFHPLGKNPGDCWIIPTAPFPEAHFAVYPPDLIRKPIRAGCPPKVCVECGKPWARIVEKEKTNVRSHKMAKGKVHDAVENRDKYYNVGGGFSRTGEQFEWAYHTIGWQPACTCEEAETETGTVLDPFAGAGTTGIVCIEEDRNYIGIELSAEYCEMQCKRLEKATRQKQHKLID